MRAKDGKLSRYLAFAPCSALDFIYQGINSEFANDDDAVKFTEFDAKGKHIGKSA
nr:hypothetical protein [uncultured Campylobacter sp.]